MEPAARNRAKGRAFVAARMRGEDYRREPDPRDNRSSKQCGQTVPRGARQRQFVGTGHKKTDHDSRFLNSMNMD